MTLIPTAMTSARPTVRHSVLLAIAAAALAAGACSDTSLTPTQPTALDKKTGALGDTSRPGAPGNPGTPGTPGAPSPDSTPSTPRPDSAPSTPRPDTLPAGAGTLWGAAVQNFVLQWKDTNGVSHDSVGFRGLAGVTVSIYATTQPDSTSSAPRQERLVATLQSDATGQFRSAKLPDGWYALRGAGGGRTASAFAQLVRGNQFPSIVYLNMR